MSRFPIASFLTAALLPLGCTDSDPCGKGEVYVDGACQKAQEKTPTKPSADAGGKPDSGTGSKPPSDFGAACNEHSDCKGMTNYCAKSPFGPPYCSASGCDADPTLCPSGWTCFNVGQFSPGEPYVCAEPTM